MALGAGLCLASVRLNLGDFHKPGPGFMPFITGIALAVLGLILAAERKGRPGPPKTGWGKKWKQVLFPLASMFGFLLLTEWLGFLLTSFLFLLFLFKLTRPNKWGEPLFISGVSSALTYYFFSVWLQCQLPKGILGM